MTLNKHYTSIISNAFGKFASKKFSPKVQRFINNSYVKLMGLDMSEFEDPSSYESLNALFTRALRVPRELPQNPDAIIAGVDARITDFGIVEQNRAYQIKGMSYDISTLFGKYHQDAIELLEGGEYVNYYLSPKDYHRYHSPLDLKIISATHIPGKLYPVNMPLLRNMPNLFIENERVIIQAEDKNGKTHILVLVGALNVGKMTVSFEPSIQTNSDITTPQHYEYQDTYLKRGEEFGYFMMGSTILTFAQKGATTHQIALNQKSRFAQVVGYLR
jgi:phosphatidylserine decarboxylase